MSERETLRGSVYAVRFRNDENGYTVLTLQCGAMAGGQQSLWTDGQITAVGNLASVALGEELELYGSWTEHPEYGEQFKFERGESVLPQGEEELERYLASGLIEGVGPATAKNIVRAFGRETLDILQDSPERLAAVKGIGKRRAQLICESFAEQTGMRNAVMGLQSMGISAAQAVKLYQAVGPNVLEDVQVNPYRLLEDVPGLGFVRVDAIAQKMGIAPNAPKRIGAALSHVLQHAQAEGGHTCYPLPAARSELLRLLPDCREEECDAILQEMVLRQELILVDLEGQEMLALPWVQHMESEAARMLLELTGERGAGASVDLRQEMLALERENAIVLDETQRRAIMNVFTAGVCVITGGPGTGKTTILRILLQLFDKLGMDVELAAPTGRAAKRLSDATDGEASTIHRLLGYTGDLFMRNQEELLECDGMIVDEMSMVDVWLLYHLLKALKGDTRLVLVGDADQLPSVGMGNVLKDLIDSDALPVTRLTQVYRQGARSRIITNAHRINEGEMPLLDYTEDFAFQQIGDKSTVLQRVLNICAEGKLGDPYTDLQVLAPAKKGVLGVMNLNERLQERLNPPHPAKGEARTGKQLFRQGDKVMQIKNNYQTEWYKPDQQGFGVFNGDMGQVAAIDQHERSVEISFDDGRTAYYTYAMLEELELAYAVTIHKSQGSEFPIVLMPLCDGPPMLFTRNLLYTAVTRARDRVVIIGWRSSLELMVGNVQERERYSLLGRELKRMAPLFGD